MTTPGLVDPEEKNVACPWCGQPADSPCRTSKGTIALRPHARRIAWAQDACATCHGTGWVNEPAGYIGGAPAYRQRKCRDCNGTGRDPAEEKP